MIELHEEFPVTLRFRCGMRSTTLACQEQHVGAILYTMKLQGWQPIGRSKTCPFSAQTEPL